MLAYKSHKASCALYSPEFCVLRRIKAAAGASNPFIKMGVTAKLEKKYLAVL